MDNTNEERKQLEKAHDQLRRPGEAYDELCRPGFDIEIFNERDETDNGHLDQRKERSNEMYQKGIQIERAKQREERNNKRCLRYQNESNLEVERASARERYLKRTASKTDEQRDERNKKRREKYMEEKIVAATNHLVVHSEIQIKRAKQRDEESNLEVERAEKDILKEQLLKLMSNETNVTRNVEKNTWRRKLMLQLIVWLYIQIYLQNSTLKRQLPWKNIVKEKLLRLMSSEKSVIRNVGKNTFNRILLLQIVQI